MNRLAAAGNRLQELLRRGVDTNNPLAAMQGLVDKTSSLFRKNPQHWWNQLSPAEKAAVASDPQGRGAAAYGNAMQRFINQLPGVAHPGQIRNLGGPNKPDYAGQGSWAGHLFELTTPAAIPAHATRPYGTMVEYVTYARPVDFLVDIAAAGYPGVRP